MQLTNRVKFGVLAKYVDEKADLEQERAMRKCFQIFSRALKRLLEGWCPDALGHLFNRIPGTLDGAIPPNRIIQ